MSHPSEERDPGEGPSSGPVVKKDTSVNSTCRTRSQQPLSDHRKGRKQEKSRVSGIYSLLISNMEMRLGLVETLPFNLRSIL